MSNDWVISFRELFAEIDFPDNTIITAPARYTFYRAMDTCLMYRGHPDVLIQALGGFLETDCRPLAYAGSARVMVHASYIQAETFDASGIQFAKDWLGIARLSTPSSLEIELVQAEIELAANALKDLRKTINKLNSFEEAANNYYVALMTMLYMARVGRKRERVRWGEIAAEQAVTDAQKIYVINRQAKHYLNIKKWHAAIEKYAELIALDKQDPWAWHNLSLCYLSVNDIRKAERCNDMALQLMDFVNARRVQFAIQDMKRGRRSR